MGEEYQNDSEYYNGNKKYDHYYSHNDEEEGLRSDWCIVEPLDKIEKQIHEIERIVFYYGEWGEQVINEDTHICYATVNKISCKLKNIKPTVDEQQIIKRKDLCLKNFNLVAHEVLQV